MSDINDAASEIAPELEATAAPVTETEQQETPAEEAAKTFTQEELDAIVAKRLAKEQRKWEREQTRQPAPPVAPLPPPPNEFDYDNAGAYAEALAERKALEIVNRREAERQQQTILAQYQAREDEAREKYDDFEQVAYNPRTPVTDTMAQAIQLSEIGPDLIYHLGSNPREADRISRLPPVSQAKEIGKLEAQLAANPPVRKSSSAPAPIAPVTPRANGATVYSTDDPRSLKSMTTSEWIEAERRRQMKRLEAQRNLG